MLAQTRSTWEGKKPPNDTGAASREPRRAGADMRKQRHRPRWSLRPHTHGHGRNERRSLGRRDDIARARRIAAAHEGCGEHRCERGGLLLPQSSRPGLIRRRNQCAADMRRRSRREGCTSSTRTAEQPPEQAAARTLRTRPHRRDRRPPRTCRGHEHQRGNGNSPSEQQTPRPGILPRCGRRGSRGSGPARSAIAAGPDAEAR